MKALIGICNHNISTVRSMIAQYEQRKGKLRVQVLGETSVVDKKAQVILVPTVHLLSKRLVALNIGAALVFVFDNPVLCEYLHPIHLLDVSEKKLSYRFNFKPIAKSEIESLLALANKERPLVKVKKDQIEVIPTMLNAQLSSILNPIQDYLYRIRDSDNKRHYNKIIYEWLASGAPVEALVRVLTKAITTKQGAKQLDLMLAELSTKEFKKTRQAFVEAFNTKAKTGKPVNYKKLGKKYGVDAWDIRYTMKVLRKFGRYQEVAKEMAALYSELKTHRESVRTKKGRP